MNQSMEAVKEFLESNNLGQYVAVFEENGIDDLDVVGHLATNEEYRETLNKVIPKLGHQMRFKEAWKKRSGSNPNLSNQMSLHELQAALEQAVNHVDSSCDQGQGLSAADNSRFQNLRAYVANLLHKVSTVLQQSCGSLHKWTKQIASSELLNEISSFLKNGMKWLVAHRYEVGIGIGILILALLVYFGAGPALSLLKSSAAALSKSLAAATTAATTTTTAETIAEAAVYAAKTAGHGEVLQNIYNIFSFSANVGRGFTGLGYQVV